MISKFDYQYEESIGQRLEGGQSDRREILDWFDAHLSRQLFEHRCPLVAHWRGSSRWFVIVKLETRWCMYGLALDEDEYAAMGFDPFHAARKHLPEVRMLLEATIANATPARIDEAVGFLRPEPIMQHLPLAYRLWLRGSDLERREQPYWSILPRGHSTRCSVLTRFAHDGKPTPLEQLFRTPAEQTDVVSESSSQDASDTGLVALRAELMRLTVRLEASETVLYRKADEQAAELGRLRDALHAAIAVMTAPVPNRQADSDIERGLEVLRSRIDDISRQVSVRPAAPEPRKLSVASLLSVVALIGCVGLTVWNFQLHATTLQLRKETVALTTLLPLPGSLAGFSEKLDSIERENSRLSMELTRLQEEQKAIEDDTRQFVRAPEGGRTDLEIILEPYVLESQLGQYVQVRQLPANTPKYLEDYLSTYLSVSQPKAGDTQRLEDHLVTHLQSEDFKTAVQALTTIALANIAKGDLAALGVKDANKTRWGSLDKALDELDKALNNIKQTLANIAKGDLASLGVNNANKKRWGSLDKALDALKMALDELEKRPAGATPRAGSTAQPLVR